MSNGYLLVWEIAGAVLGVVIAGCVGYMLGKATDPELLRRHELVSIVMLAYAMVEMGLGLAFIGQIMGSTSPDQIGGVLLVAFLAWSAVGVVVGVGMLARALEQMRRAG